MKKNITNILQKGNIRPRDRVLLLVADDTSKERDGKSILTEADRHALAGGWTPKNNSEVVEYNLYNEARRSLSFGELDAQTTYLSATNSLLRTERYLNFYLDNRKDDTILKHLAKDKQEEALSLVLDHLGLELDYIIYLYAFELADKELQEDLLALYPDAKTEQRYLEQEEIIYKLFNGKDKLDKDDKEKLAELITDKCYNQYLDEWYFGGYFAELPLIEIGKRLVSKSEFYKEIKAETDEDIIKELELKLKGYKKNKELLTNIIIGWIDEGLFVKDFTPLYLSEDKETCNNKETKLIHKEVFKKWLEVKAKATKTIQGLIDKGELKTIQKTKSFKNFNKLISDLSEYLGGIKDETRQDKPTKEVIKTIITGESLYNSKSDYQFIKDFKKQAEDFRVFGALVLFLRECHFVKEYATLLAFLELYKKLSKVFETDLTFKIKDYIKKFNADFALFRKELIILLEDIVKENYKTDRVYYLSESYLEELLSMPFDIENVKPDTERLKVYFDAFKKILEDEF
jgi:hypothetical protein